MFDGLPQVMYYCSMKISKITHHAFYFIFGFAFAGGVLSCGSTKVEPPEEPAPIVEDEPPVVQEEPLPVIEEESPSAEEELPVIEEPVVEPVAQADDDEYARSVGDVAVSRDTFESDKEAILRIISELDVIMKDLNYNSWVQYVDNESINYWKLRKNLQKAEKRLPVKGIKLRDLEDFFKQFFVPARRGKTITEIRYISDVYVKAIQVQEGQDDIVFYYFNKINGKWMVHIPPIEN